MTMKKTYIAPETDIYAVNAVKVLAGSIKDGDDEGTIGFNDGETSEGDFELGARDNNYRGNIWDNAW
jgi:hypothetical protein